MSGQSDERSVETLRRRAERAMDEGRGRRVVEPLLERILKVAPEGDPGRIFAHRHLAELRLEEDPWAAALHLRKVIGARPHDDVSQSLMALAQALLGNYRAAVAAYRRALSLEPKNPWYHHNLGHLLDVALDEPYAALAHLEVALAHADPPEHEITASVAHCLARVGRAEQARELAEQALRAAPQNGEHRALLSWIENGAPPGKSTQGLNREPRRPSAAPRGDEQTRSDPRSRRTERESRGTREPSVRSVGRDGHPGSADRPDGRGPPGKHRPRPGEAANRQAHVSSLPGARDLAGARARAGASSTSASPTRADGERTEALDAKPGSDVERLLIEQMQAAGFSARQVKHARALWADYREEREPRVKRPEVCAAAVHYAIVVVDGVDGISQAAVARHYGVTAKSVSSRYGDIRRALALRRADPRYAR